MFQHRKKTFKAILLLLTLLLLALPAITTFNEILTSLVMQVKIYSFIQNLVVPIQAKMITLIVRQLGILATPSVSGIYIGNPQVIGNHVTISWNCIGWQSLLLFFITLVTGLQGPYTKFSKLQTVTIGTFGTFLVNVFRISLVVIVAKFISKAAAIVFHDYFSTMIIIAWLLFFWWFIFSFVLEVKADIQDPTPTRKKLYVR